MINTDIQTIAEIINGRRAIRHYESEYAIPEEQIREMIELAARAPSSSNLQPWRFIVVNDKVMQEQLVPIAYNQKQVGEASAVILIFADTKMYEKAQQIADSAYEAGYATEEVRDRMAAGAIKLYGEMPQERLKDIALFDAGLAAMNIMLVARSYGYATGPMGGFDHKKVKEMFQLPEHYVPTLMLTIGKAVTPGHPSARLPVQEILGFNKKPAQ